MRILQKESTDKPPQAQLGFTLLEMLVAVAIFAIMSTVLYSALLQFLSMRDRVLSVHEKLSDLQTTYVLLRNDIRFALNRPNKSFQGEKLKQGISFNQDGSLIRLISLNQDYRFSQTTLPRLVVWSLNDDELIREMYFSADPAPGAFSSKQVLLSNVSDLSVNLRSIEKGNIKVVSAWEEQDSLPGLVEIDLSFADNSNYVWRFEPPNSGFEVDTL